MTLLLPFDQRADDQQDPGYANQRNIPVTASENATTAMRQEPVVTPAELPDSLRENRVTPEHSILAAHRKDDSRPRQWSIEAKAASIFIAHALEYLSDSRNLSTGRYTTLDPADPNAQAIEILLQARRDIYLACPYIERRSNSWLKGKFLGFERRKDRQN